MIPRWAVAVLVYSILIAGAIFAAAYPYVSASTDWGVLLEGRRLIYFSPSSGWVVADGNGTAVAYFNGRWLSLNVTATAACQLGDQLIVVGSSHDRPSLVDLSGSGATYYSVDDYGYLTAVSCQNGVVAAAGVLNTTPFPPYRLLAVSLRNGSLRAYATNFTTLVPPYSAAPLSGGVAVAFSDSYLVYVNPSGAQAYYYGSNVTIDYVGSYDGAPLLAGSEMVNDLQEAMISLNGTAYVYSDEAYVFAAARTLNGLALYLRPPSGWASVLYTYGGLPEAETTAALDYPFSLTAAYPFLHGIVYLGQLFVGSGSDYIAVYINGTVQGYLEANGSVIGWATSSRPAVVTPSLLERSHLSPLGSYRLSLQGLNVSASRGEPAPTGPLRLEPIRLDHGFYNNAVGYSVDAIIVGTVILAFTERRSL